MILLIYKILKVDYFTQFLTIDPKFQRKSGQNMGKSLKTLPNAHLFCCEEIPHTPPQNEWELDPKNHGIFSKIRNRRGFEGSER